MSCSFGTLCPSYNCMTSYVLRHLYCRSVKIISDTEPVRGSKKVGDHWPRVLIFFYGGRVYRDMY